MRSLNENNNCLTQNSLDHNLVSLPFVASEDADSMDVLFRGTEEEVESMHASASSMYCELINILFVAYEKRWLLDGTGLMASKSVSVAPVVFLECLLIPHVKKKKVDVMPESK